MTAQLPEVNKNSTLYGQDYWKCDRPSPIHNCPTQSGRGARAETDCRAGRISRIVRQTR